jgi:hypothetical protein
VGGTGAFDPTGGKETGVGMDVTETGPSRRTKPPKPPSAPPIGPKPARSPAAGFAATKDEARVDAWLTAPVTDPKFEATLDKPSVREPERLERSEEAFVERESRGPVSEPTPPEMQDEREPMQLETPEVMEERISVGLVPLVVTVTVTVLLG